MEGNHPKKMLSGGWMDKRHASAHAFRCRGRQVVAGELMEGICIYVCVFIITYCIWIVCIYIYIHVFVYLCNVYTHICISFNVYIYYYYYLLLLLSLLLCSIYIIGGFIYWKRGLVNTCLIVYDNFDERLPKCSKVDHFWYKRPGWILSFPSSQWAMRLWPHRF